MWNVFDTSFVIIFLLYTILRIKGLATNDGEFRILVWVLKLKGRSSQSRHPRLVSTFSLVARAFYFPGDLT